MKFLKRQDSFLSNKILLGSGGIILTILILYLFTGGLTRIHSDSAAPLNIALEMMRTGELFPDGWIGSTGIFTFQLPIWLFLQFIPDYLIAKACAQLLWTFLFIASVIFMCKKLLKNNSWIVGIPVLLTCFSIELQYDMLYIQCAYTATVFMTLYTIGAFGWAVVDFETWKVRRKRFSIMCLFMLLSCSLGIILVEALLIPMLGSIVILYIHQHKNHSDIATLPYIKQLLYILFSVGIAGIIGCLCYIQLADLSGMVGNAGATTLATSIDQFTDNMLMIVQGILFYIGFPTIASIFSVDGILSVIRLVAFVALTIIFPILAYKNYDGETKQTQFFLCFTLIHVIESIIVIIMTCMVDYTGVSRYLLTSIVLLNLVSTNYIYNHYIQKENLLAFLYSMGVSIITIVMMIPAVKSVFWYQSTLDSMKGLTIYLEDQGLTYGYSSFWKAGTNTVLSNGDVQVNGILISPNQVAAYYWLSSKDWYDPEFYKGKSFLLLSNTEVGEYAPNGYANTKLGEPDEVLNYGDMVILVYGYNIAENDFTGILDGSKNYVPNSMAVSDPSMVQEDQSIHVQPGQLMYGPYITLGAGNYELVVEAELLEPQELRITASAGQEQIYSAELENGTTVIPFTLESEKIQVEFVVQNAGNETIKLTTLRLSKQN